MVRLVCPKCGRRYDAVNKRQAVWCVGKAGRDTMGHPSRKMKEVKET